MVPVTAAIIIAIAISVPAVIVIETASWPIPVAAEELAAEMLATTLGVGFDPDRSWDEKKEIYRISNRIVKVTNITQSAIGDKKGLWTTVVAGAVFIPEPLYVPEDS